MGLRKFVVAGVGPLGCIPNQRATGLGLPGRCVDNVNQMLGDFNEGLRSLVVQLNTQNPDSTFVYTNVYGIFGDILNNPDTYGETIFRFYVQQKIKWGATGFNECVKCRVSSGGHSVLWSGAEQRSHNVSPAAISMPEPQRARVLGCLPPNGGCLRRARRQSFPRPALRFLPHQYPTVGAHLAFPQLSIHQPSLNSVLCTMFLLIYCLCVFVCLWFLK